MTRKRDRLRFAMSLGIPGFTIVIVVIYVFVWLIGNANPALQPRPADQRIVQQITGIPQSLWQEVGSGGLTSPWHVLDAEPTLAGPHGHPELFYVGGEFCEFCATERWAMINALSRFGTFAHLSQLRSYDEQIATFSFFQSTYFSLYIDFVPVEHVGNSKDIFGQFVTRQPFTGVEQTLYERYDSTRYLPMSQGLPFMDLDNRYVLGGGITASYLQNTRHQPLSWQEIAVALSTPSSPIAKQVLGTANYLTAAICLVTRQLPQSVCKVPTIQSLEAQIGT